PVAPFFADWLYGRVTQGNGALGSVHAADFPTADAAITDAALERRMALARAIVGNVLALRNQAGINVRQVLSRILVVEEAAVARADVEAVAAIIRSEVNVDAIEFVAGTGDLVKRSAKPNYRVLGRRLGSKMKAVAAAVAGLSDEAVAAYMVDKALDLGIGGETVTLGEDDLLISAEGVEGWLVGREDGVTVALDSTLSDSLRSRGLAREVVNRVQRLRKQADFHVADRIRVAFATGDAALGSAIEAHGAMIARETLAVAYEAAAAPEGEAVEAFDIDGAQLKLALRRVSAA